MYILPYNTQMCIALYIMATFCKVVAFRKAVIVRVTVRRLAAEAVESASLPLERVHHVHGSHRLPLGVLGVGHCVPDDVLQEHLQDTASLLVDEAADSLHTTSASKTTDGGLGDALDVVTKDLPVTLCASLAKALASFAASSHDDEVEISLEITEE